MNKIYKILLVSIMLFSSFLIAGTDKNSPNEKLKKVSIQLNWKHQFEFAGFYMAKEKGFYKKMGLDVQIKEFSEGINIAKEVTSGKSTFGVDYPTLILDRARGQNVVLLAAILQSSPHVLVSLKSSGIKSVKDFRNKKIMIGENAANTASFIAMFLANNIYFKDMIKVKESFNINDLINHKTDIYSCYISDEIFTLKEKKVAYNIWDPKDYGFDFYDELLFTSQKELKNHPNIVRNFRRATIKGWEYAFSHISETMDIILKRYNTQHKSRKALFYEGETLKKLAYYKNKKIGTIDKSKIQRIYDIYHFIGLTKRSINLNSFIYKKALNHNGFDKKETDYLKKEKVIKICTNPNWEPIEFVSKGKAKGISIDTLNIILGKLHIKSKYIKTSSWSESQRFLKEGKCDILPSAIKTSKREKYANFTKPYLSYNLVIVTTKNKPLVQNLESIIDKSMSRKKGSGLISKLKAKYPKIKILETKDYKDAFEAVEKHKVYFTIATLPVLSYYKNMYNFNNLQISGYMNKKYKLSIAVRKDDPILLDILDKELSHLSSNIKNIIYEKWASKKIEKKSDYSLIYKIAGVVFVIFLIMIFRYIVIKKYNKKLQKEVQKAKIDLQEKQMQLQQQSRHAQMGEMISMIAHQWRQPLAAISSTSSAINLKAKLKKLDSDTAIELSDKISNYSQHLSQTIDDFREFFKPNKEKVEVNYTQLIKSVLDIIQVSIKNKNIRLEQELNCEDRFFTYPNEIKQVLLNLIKNAEDVLLEKEIKNPCIKIKSFKEKDKLILEISDNAGGIPKDIIDKIFDPYFSTKTKKDGTGLGLYMSKTIIEGHCNGKLNVKNDDFGAVFTIVLGVDNG